MNKNTRLVVGVLLVSMFLVLVGSLFLLGSGWDETSRKAVGTLGASALVLALVVFRWEDFKSIPSELRELFADDRDINMHPEVGESFVNRDVVHLGSSRFKATDQADKYVVSGKPQWIDQK